MAGAKSNAYEQALLELIFQAKTYDNIADNAGSSPLTELWFSLHTATPDEDGEQGTNETAYGGYSRVAVTRSTDGFVVSTSPSGSTEGASVAPTSNITFPECTGTSATITHFAIGKTSDSTGGEILYYGGISPTLSVSSGVTPRLTTDSAITEA